MPVEDPEPFSGRFVQIFLHQDLSTYLRQKSLNLCLSIIRLKVKEIRARFAHRACPWKIPYLIATESGICDQKNKKAIF